MNWKEKEKEDFKIIENNISRIGDTYIKTSIRYVAFISKKIGYICDRERILKFKPIYGYDNTGDMNE